MLNEFKKYLLEKRELEKNGKKLNGKIIGGRLMVEKLLNYDGLIAHLKKKGYDEIKSGEFIICKDEDLGLDDVLVVKKGSNYKKDLQELKDRFKKEESTIEGNKIAYAILFVDNYILFLKSEYVGLEYKTIVLKRSLDKISPAFKKKLKKLSKDFGTWKYWNELFDRSDIVEEFYKLYVKAREMLIKNMKGINDDKKKNEFADNLMMQLLITWYLQEMGFLDGNKNYLINKFKEYKNLGFNNYYTFLRELFSIMKGLEIKEPYYKDKTFGTVIITGPAPFINGEFRKNVEILDDVFYMGEDKTIELKKSNPKNIKEVPILNLFDSRDWTEGNIDEFVLGAIFEKLMNAEEQKDRGAYYTPEKITQYISNNTICPYLVDKINGKFGTNYESLDEFFKREDDLDKYKYLYEVLQDIKILDPACGSGHFLETAIEVLVKIYKKLRDNARNLNFKNEDFTIVVADENGDIKNEDLLTIDDEEFELKVKFHIIVSKNIYGVDIQKSAIKVAKARMFLTLAKHFNPKKGILIRFPNVHFNIRAGNSLIGFTDFSGLKKVAEQKQLTLNELFNSNITSKPSKSKPLNIKISNKEFEDYLSKLDKKLKLNLTNSLNEVEEIYDRKLTENNIKKVLELKEKLIKVLLVSLNSKFVNDIKEILDNINDAFNEKLNEEYLNYLKEKNLKISDKDFENIGHFHWIMEFSEVFIGENTGFDIVIGNPPYIRQEKINDIVEEVDYKEILSKSYEPYDKTFDLSMFFILRSIELLKDKGYHSFIITNKWLRAKYGKKIRKYLKENSSIIKVIDFNGVKVFVGATVDTLIYILKKEKPEKDNKIFYNNPRNLEDIEKKGYYVKQSKLDDDNWNFVDERTLEIKEWIEKVGVPLKKLDVKIYRGITTGFNELTV